MLKKSIIVLLFFIMAVIPAIAEDSGEIVLDETDTLELPDRNRRTA